ncbi:MAG TPA: tetratricopeptide repeat protein [Terriglobales bacterium]|nr:tetratricopeptide repeat protein [Terriglobales bacterium]
MLRILLSCTLFVGFGAAQDSKPSRVPPPNQAPPRSEQSEPSQSGQPAKATPSQDRPAGFSSSKEAPIDLSPPEGDAKDHPNSAIAVREAEDAAGLYEGDEIGGIQEFHPWDPHKADKDVEVGDFYFKLKNYRAARDRYEEALYYKNNDAVATFRLAVCHEKLGDTEEARDGYEAYLKILPEGPLAAQAHHALERLKASAPASGPDGTKARSQ